MTFVRFLTSVSSFMTLKFSFSIKRFRACVTFVWFLTSVCSIMSFQILFSSKSTRTCTTFVCFFINVSPLMTFKICFSYVGQRTCPTIIHCGTFCRSDDHRPSNKPEPLHNDFWDTLYCFSTMFGSINTASDDFDSDLFSRSSTINTF